MTDADALLDDLEAADATYREHQSRIEELDAARVDAVRDAYERVTDLLDRYEKPASGTGDFKAYVEFEEAISDLVDDLPDDLRRRDAFEAAGDRMDKRRLSERDFEAAREDLAPARELVDLLDDRDEARVRYREARRAVSRARSDVESRIEAHERLLELGEADLDAPVEELRDPVESYNDAVRAALDDLTRERPAREVLSLVATAAARPLVDYRAPPADLREYVETHAAGDHAIPKLVEYATYSRSKLDHYVDDVDALKHNVATHRTYLERLDAGPLTVAWPPDPARVLRWRIEELIPVVARFAPEETVAALRTVRALTRDEARFERLRNAATAIAELDAAERERLASGAVADELADLRAESEALAAALADYPSR